MSLVSDDTFKQGIVLIVVMLLGILLAVVSSASRIADAIKGRKP